MSFFLVVNTLENCKNEYLGSIMLANDASYCLWIKYDTSELWLSWDSSYIAERLKLMILLKSVILTMGSGLVGSIFVEIDGGIF